MTAGEETGPGGGMGGTQTVSHLKSAHGLLLPYNLILIIQKQVVLGFWGSGFSTSSVDQQHHLSLFGVFLQDSLDLRREI